MLVTLIFVDTEVKNNLHGKNKGSNKFFSIIGKLSCQFFVFKQVIAR